MIRRISEKIALMLLQAHEQVTIQNYPEYHLDLLRANPDGEILISPEGIKLRCKPLSLNPNHYEWILLGYQEDQSDILRALERLDPSALESIFNDHDDLNLFALVKGPYNSGKAWAYRYVKSREWNKWVRVNKTTVN